jgi:hypothetical protein
MSVSGLLCYYLVHSNLYVFLEHHGWGLKCL